MTGDSRDHLGERGVSPWPQREEVGGENAEPAGITQGTLLDVMWQPGWEGDSMENGYTYMYG